MWRAKHPLWWAAGECLKWKCTHLKNRDQGVDVHAGLGYATPPSLHETLFKRHRDLVEAVEPHAPENSAGFCIGITDHHIVGRHGR